MKQHLTVQEWQTLFEPDPFIIHKLEKTILRHYDYSRNHKSGKIKALLRFRKSILDYYALQHQSELLPDIIEFNDVLKKNLRQMYEKTLHIWKDMIERQGYGSTCRLSSYCYFNDGEYPALHPAQTQDRKNLWPILNDSAYNPEYRYGVSIAPLMFNDYDLEKDYFKGKEGAFEDFIGLKSTPPNWNEGFDRGLTRDLHIISPFHHLFESTNFALTDILYVRSFMTNFNLELSDIPQILSERP